MAQQVIKNEGASECENWHLSHDLAEIYATVAGHIIQLELTPKLLTTVTRQRRPANRRTAACRARREEIQRYRDIHAFGEVPFAVLLFRNISDRGIATHHHTAIKAFGDLQRADLSPARYCPTLALTNTS